MINQEKVRDMTRMAAYENGDGEKEIRISTYRKQDYVALQLIKAFFSEQWHMPYCLFSGWCCRKICSSVLTVWKRSRKWEPEYVFSG